MSVFKPDAYLTSIEKVDLGNLWDRGIRCLLLDMDNTIRPRDTHVVPQSVLDWLDEARGLGFRMCVVSNNWHGNVLEESAKLGLDVVHRSMKPLPFAFSKARRRCGCSKRESVMIGDELFTDILGGNLAGLMAILVVPQSDADIRFTARLRKLEERLLGDSEPSE